MGDALTDLNSGMTSTVAARNVRKSRPSGTRLSVSMTACVRHCRCSWCLPRSRGLQAGLLHAPRGAGRLMRCAPYDVRVADALAQGREPLTMLPLRAAESL